jgi:adenylosuccinate synthase
MRAIAVIDSAWGDSGKGAAVDALAAAPFGTLVVRHSGGAQAGHTVVTPGGHRHVFSHFCSGALAGAPGHLSEHFVVNPRIFCVERSELFGTSANLNLTVDPRALVTTPLDVAINRAMERNRGNNRHGSVGIGFGETIERSERGFPLRVSDLIDTDRLTAVLGGIILDWARKRWDELDLEQERINWASFYDEAKTFMSHVKLAELSDIVPLWDCGLYCTVIFEGAQGLLLDQRRGMTFPYVTRSNTGLQNVLPMAEQIGARNLQVVYMMRPYLTRHGAGPLPGETATLDGIEVVDPTNQHGEWQGPLRLAPMDYSIVADAIRADLAEAPGVEPYIGISCLDQVKDHDRRHAISDRLEYVIGHPLAIGGHGPSRDKYQIAFTQPLRKTA